MNADAILMQEIDDAISTCRDNNLPLDCIELTTEEWRLFTQDEEVRNAEVTYRGVRIIHKGHKEGEP